RPPRIHRTRARLRGGVPTPPRLRSRGVARAALSASPPPAAPPRDAADAPASAGAPRPAPPGTRRRIQRRIHLVTLGFVHRIFRRSQVPEQVLVRELGLRRGRLAQALGRVRLAREARGLLLEVARLALPVLRRAEVRERRREGRVLPAPRDPRRVPDEAEGAQRLDEAQPARLEVAELAVGGGHGL